jgi:hypothetical protein
MTDLETEVRSILSDLADGAPPSAGLVEVVHARGRRARHRRLAVAAAAAAVAVLAAGAVTVSLRDPGTTLQVATPAEPQSGLPPAPVRLGELPSGFSQLRVAIFDTGTWRIRATRTNPGADLEVSVGRTKPRRGNWTGVKSQTVTLDGQPATLTTEPINDGDSMALLTFQRKPGQWITVSVLTRSTTDPFKVVSQAELRAVATGLTDRPTPVAQLLRIGSVPAPLRICASDDGSGQQYDTSQVAYCDPRVKTLPVYLNGTLPAVPDNAAVQVYWQHVNGKWWTDQKSGTQRTPIEINGRQGSVAAAGTAAQRLWYGWIRLADGVRVNVEMREPNLFTRSQFVEFLGSITPGQALK